MVDDIVFVGSSNLDPRSLRINLAIMLRIHDTSLAATEKPMLLGQRNPGGAT